MKVVRCNRCGKWLGWENEINVIQTDARDEVDDYIDYEACPSCGAIDSIMDLDHCCGFTDDEVEQLWMMFCSLHGAVDGFLGFDAGTDIFDVLKWFDEKYSAGIAALVRTKEALKQKKYIVQLKGWLEVEAENTDEALEIALDNLEKMYVTDHYEAEKIET